MSPASVLWAFSLPARRIGRTGVALLIIRFAAQQPHPTAAFRRRGSGTGYLFWPHPPSPSPKERKRRCGSLLIWGPATSSAVYTRQVPAAPRAIDISPRSISTPLIISTIALSKPVCRQVSFGGFRGLLKFHYLPICLFGLQVFVK